MTGGDTLISCLTCMPGDPFDSKPFTVDVILGSLGKISRSPALIDTGATGMAFIDESLMPELCERFGIQPVPLSKPKPIRSYDGTPGRKPITHALYTSIMMQEHKDNHWKPLVEKEPNSQPASASKGRNRREEDYSL